jgi:hypothetical protein
MSDATEAIRREQVQQINADPGSREALEARHGRVWSTEEMRDEFEVVGFLAPLVVVRRRSDGVLGSLQFQHSGRACCGWPSGSPPQGQEVGRQQEGLALESDRLAGGSHS